MSEAYAILLEGAFSLKTYKGQDAVRPAVLPGPEIPLSVIFTKSDD